MKFPSSQAALLCLGLTILVCCAISLADEQESSKRNAISLPKIFNFEHFKAIFKRRYASVVEELARKKIFLGRAFRAFLSVVKYKHFGDDKYLKISEMSDWTEAEFLSTLKRRPSRKNKLPPTSENKIVAEEQTPIASEADIERKLEEIKNAPEFKEINEELSSIAAASDNLARRKRDLAETSRRSRLASDYLLDYQENDYENESDEVLSNNPNYQAPELNSFGGESLVLNRKSMDDDKANSILSLPGWNYVSSLISQTSNYLFDSNDIVKPSGEIEDKGASRKSRLPDEVFVDHRESGCFLMAKNQGQCGSCYLFSTTALYEWQYCQESGEKTAFSEQYPLDCGERSELKGCDGGQEYEAAAFFGKFGLELRKKYPYRQQSDICPYEPSTSEQNMGYLKLKNKYMDDGAMVRIDFDDLEKQLIETPILMGVAVTPDFPDYGGGVDANKGCDEDRGHSMLIVGNGREDGNEYWLFRNSYGPSWGEKGYYKLNKKSSYCLLDDGVGYILKSRGKDKKIFKPSENQNYDPKVVKARYDAIKYHKKIPHNPFTWIDPDAERDKTAVTPPTKSVVELLDDD